MSLKPYMSQLEKLNDTDQRALKFLSGRKDAMVEKAKQWSAINTYSGNLQGLQKFAAILQEELAQLDCSIDVIETPPMEKVADDGSIIQTFTAPVIEARARVNFSLKYCPPTMDINIIGSTSHDSHFDGTSAI